MSAVNKATFLGRNNYYIREVSGLTKGVLAKGVATGGRQKKWSSEKIVVARDLRHPHKYASVYNYDSAINQSISLSTYLSIYAYFYLSFYSPINSSIYHPIPRP